ncbi:MAG: flagellar basal body-associated FliL family protein [Candidatus Aminicenantes bacterium]|nr:flagellar basal body-associated FliL family protein [Candidatus Aminicenantes bacterium]
MADESFRDRGEGLTRAKKSGFPLILIVIIIAVVMGAGGFFAGKILSGGGGNNQKPPLIEKKMTPVVKKDAAARQGGQTQPKEQKEEITGTGEGEAGIKPGIILLDPFTVNLNDPFARRYAEVAVNLVVDEKGIVSEITGSELLIPRIRDEIFMVISARSFADLKSTAGKVTLKEEIMIRVNEILKAEFKKEPVIQVLFTKFLIQ